eukprot:gene17020-56573_t
MVRRSKVAEAAELMRHHSLFATEDGNIIDDAALAALPEHGVPAFLLPLLYVADEEEVEQAMKESAGSGAADAQQDDGDDAAPKSAMERLVEMGMARMAQVPAACLEGEDPMAPLERVLEKVAAADKRATPDDPDAPDWEVQEALSSVERAAEMPID